MAHVTSPHEARAVGQTIGVPVVGRLEHGEAHKTFAIAQLMDGCPPTRFMRDTVETTCCQHRRLGVFCRASDGGTSRQCLVDRLVDENQLGTEEIPRDSHRHDDD